MFAVSQVCESCKLERCIRGVHEFGKRHTIRSICVVCGRCYKECMELEENVERTAEFLI